MWTVYILECQNGALYVGLTDDLVRRFSEHKKGIGGHYTNYNRAIKIVYSENIAQRVDAEQRERQIKRWSRKKKLALIAGNMQMLRRLSQSRE